ncbi:MAG: hypothetical protein K6E91_09445, partial [Butyrivibrio sp.]|nr:hypothetical protein [Butyrivibrio sp.]
DEKDKDAKADEKDKDAKADEKDKDAKADEKDKDAKADEKDKDAKADEKNKDAKSDESAKSDKSSETKTSIPFRFALKNEGARLMLANEDYYKEFTQNKLDYIMQKKNATMDEYKKFAGEQVLDWTPEEKDMISRAMKEIEDTVKGRGWKLPPIDTIVFIKTTMDEEGGVGAYTHGTQIYLKELDKLISKEELSDELVPEHFLEIIAHEIFHCLTRCNPDFRKEMYNVIGFTVEDKDYKIPSSVWEYYISNPDVEHHNSHAIFDIDGKKIDCFVAAVTKKHFEKKGDSFPSEMVPALVPVDGSDKYYFKEDASNFDDLFGKNTDYVIDPEECMADNFRFAVVYGKKGPEGKGYETPEIIDRIYEILAE